MTYTVSFVYLHVQAKACNSGIHELQAFAFLPPMSVLAHLTLCAPRHAEANTNNGRVAAES